MMIPTRDLTDVTLVRKDTDKDEVYRRLSRHSPRATATSNPVLVFLAGTFLNLIRKLKIFGEEVHTATLFGFDLSQRVSLGKKLL